MNKELLFQLYAIHSPSGNEKKMRKFLRKQAYARGAASVVTDAFGNLLIVKGESDTYPCLAAHMDQVQREHSKDFKVFEHNDVAFAFSANAIEQQGLGADDKNGIFICLECLEAFDAIKIAFFVGEEIGCVGSKQVDLQFFKDCRFIIEPDRMHGSDLITSMFCGEVCSEDFIKAIDYKRYGYKPEHGSITDVGTLVERGVGISCLNLSCGYYNAHTSEEITILSELENCLDFVKDIIATCTDVYPFEHIGWWDYDWYGHRGGKRGKDDLSYFDEEDYYYSSGMYDEDVDRMQSYLEIYPNLSFESIYSNYLEEFQANWCFSRERDRRSNLEDIYTYVLEKINNYEDISMWEWDKEN